LSPEVFAHSPRPPKDFSFDYGSSHRVSLPFNVSPDVPTQPSKEVQVALLRFCPLRRISSSGAHLPRACLTRYVAPSGFLNLLTLSFSRSRPALFHAGNALGVPPFRAFPLSSAAFRLIAGASTLMPLTKRFPKESLRLDSRALCREQVRCSALAYFSLVEARCSPGLFSPPGYSPSPPVPARSFRNPAFVPLMDLESGDSQSHLVLSCRVLPREKLALTLPSLPTLLGFLAFSSFL
jgi:hypothetical protein